MKKKYTAVIVFFSTPAHGHVNPALPILSELAKRGCRVIFYGTDELWYEMTEYCPKNKWAVRCSCKNARIREKTILPCHNSALCVTNRRRHSESE